MLRGFIFQGNFPAETLRITESSTPNTFILSVSNHEGTKAIELSADTHAELQDLFEPYGSDKIRFTTPESVFKTDISQETDSLDILSKAADVFGGGS